MTDAAPPSPKMKLVIGFAAAAAGSYFLLIGTGVLPIPGGSQNLHGPLWIVFCAGLAFFLGGAAVILQVLGGANEGGEFRPDASFGMRMGQYLIGVAIFASLAAIGSWIAFGPGERAFSGSIGFASGDVGAIVGRIVFGTGAVIAWLGAIAFAVSGARKFLGRARASRAAKETE